MAIRVFTKNKISKYTKAIIVYYMIFLTQKKIVDNDSCVKVNINILKHA